MVVLALPAQAVGTLLPAIDPPCKFHPIVNAHFRVDDPPEVPEQAGLIGIVGGTAQWVFFRDNIISVTVKRERRTCPDNPTIHRERDLARRESRYFWASGRTATAAPRDQGTPCHIFADTSVDSAPRAV